METRGFVCLGSIVRAKSISTHVKIVKNIAEANIAEMLSKQLAEPAKFYSQTEPHLLATHPFLSLFLFCSTS
jgi:hypothetical protein